MCAYLHVGTYWDEYCSLLSDMEGKSLIENPQADAQNGEPKRLSLRIIIFSWIILVFLIGGVGFISGLFVHLLPQQHQMARDQNHNDG